MPLGEYALGGVVFESQFQILLDFWYDMPGPLRFGCVYRSVSAILPGSVLYPSLGRSSFATWIVYFEIIRVFKAGVCSF